MRLAKIAVSALVVLLALGCLFLWLAPARSASIGKMPATTEPPRVGLGAKLAPVEATGGKERISQPSEGAPGGPEPTTETVAADHEVSDAGSHPKRELAKEVLLARSARIEGIVLDRFGAPATEALVTARARWQDLKAGNPNTTEGGLGPTIVPAFKTATSGQGSYALEVAPEIDLWLEIAHEDRLVLQERLRLQPGEVRVIDLRLAESGTIAGLVLGTKGEPVKGQRVTLVREWKLHRVEPRFADAESDADGRFSFSLVPPGAWVVGPFEDVGDPAVVDLPPGAETVEVVLHVGDGLFVRGRCVGPDGNAVGEMFVWTLAGKSTVSGKSTVLVKSAPDGTFALGPLGAGAYEIHVTEKDGYAASERLLAQAGDEDVLVRLGRAARIHGMVVDAAGAGQPAQIQFVLKYLDGSSEFTFHEARDQGRFEISRLGAGSYVLLARTPAGLVSAPLMVSVGGGDDLDVELQVVPGGQVHILLPPNSYAVVLTDGEVADFGLKDGATSRPLRPGPITIEVFKDGVRLDPRQATISAGEVVEVDLR